MRPDVDFEKLSHDHERFSLECAVGTLLILLAMIGGPALILWGFSQ